MATKPRTLVLGPTTGTTLRPVHALTRKDKAVYWLCRASSLLSGAVPVDWQYHWQLYLYRHGKGQKP